MTDETQSELGIKSAELQLKKDELAFRKQEAKLLHRLERIKTWGTVVSLAGAALGIVVPIWIAAMNIRAQARLAEEQARLAEEQARLTFQMKVADLALVNATKAEQVRERARAFIALFNPNQDTKSLLPPNFADNFDPEQFKLDMGNSVRTREQLIALLAQHPQQRQQILADWYVLFPWHHWWVEPILEAADDERKLLDERSLRLQQNEQRLN